MTSMPLSNLPKQAKPLKTTSTMRPAFATSSGISVLKRATSGALRAPISRRSPQWSISARMNGGGPVLICDVLDTLVADPFSRGMSSHFGFTCMDSFLAAKRPGTWERFELGLVSEGELSTQFFKDGRTADIGALKRFMSGTYTLLPGCADMLRAFADAGVQVHLCSNYGPWTGLIEEKLGLEKMGAMWTFVSASHGVRKPDARAYHVTARLAGVPVEECVLLDDRQRNCDGAVDAGYKGAVRFRDMEQAREELSSFFGEWLRLAPSAL